MNHTNIALAIACIWAASYVVAVATGDASVVAFGTPVAMVAIAYLFGHDITKPNGS